MGPSRTGRGALHRVLQLPDFARIGGLSRDSARVHPGHLRPCRRLKRSRSGRRAGDVLVAAAQGGQLHPHHVDPIVEVLAERARRICSAKSRWWPPDPHVRGPGAGGAQGSKCAPGGPEQAHLQRRLTSPIRQEQGAALGQGEATRACRAPAVKARPCSRRARTPAGCRAGPHSSRPRRGRPRRGLREWMPGPRTPCPCRSSPRMSHGARAAAMAGQPNIRCMSGLRSPGRDLRLPPLPAQGLHLGEVAEGFHPAAHPARGIAQHRGDTLKGTRPPGVVMYRVADDGLAAVQGAAQGAAGLAHAGACRTRSRAA